MRYKHKVEVVGDYQRVTIDELGIVEVPKGVILTWSDDEDSHHGYPIATMPDGWRIWVNVWLDAYSMWEEKLPGGYVSARDGTDDFYEIGGGWLIERDPDPCTFTVLGSPLGVLREWAYMVGETLRRGHARLGGSPSMPVA